MEAKPKDRVWQHCPLTDKFEPKPLYTGKNPSYLDRSNKPHLINHQQYQNRLPSEGELQDWFANPANGVGTLGGWNNTVWLDFDVKNFTSQEECDRAIHSTLAQSEMKQTFIARTQSGGWRVGVRVKQKPEFTNFALTPGGTHVGEALGAGRFTVLYGIGPSGNPYLIINCAIPVEVESLEVIGIYSTKKHKQERQSERLTPPPLTLVPSSIPLEMLGNDLSRHILEGNSPTSDRSEALATALQEWYGWQNWSAANGIQISGDAKTLGHHAGAQLGIDLERVEMKTGCLRLKL